MSDIIHVLSDAVANQIAAGEVIQRPASLVKELMENAVDAGANDIKVIIKDAGKTLVQVVDNGKGMSPADAALCFQRHATSKISRAEDLFAITTRGFRGEAMASIGAVAEVSLKTRPRNEELGTHIRLAGSEVQLNEAIQSAPGTNIQVSNLFFNIPARRKFLKSDQTEFRHIINEFNHVALTYPEIGFSLLHNGTEILQLPATNSRQRIAGIFGKSINNALLPLETETSLIRISGFIGKAEYARKTQGEQFFFVNRRYIRHGYFHKAVLSAYEQILAPDHVPAYFISFELDPSRIDVNIHPTKTEVKFEDANAIWQILQASVREAIGKHNLSPTLDFSKEGVIDIPVLTNDTAIRAPEIDTNPGYNPFEEESAYKRPKPTIYGNEERTKGWEQLFEPGNGSANRPNRYLQLKNKYILSPVKSGLMLIDQRRAHERILYDHMLQSLKNQKAVSQQSLFPVNIPLHPADYQLCLEMIPELEQLGFDVRDFGNNHVVVHGIPGEAGESDCVKVLEDLIEQFKVMEGDIGTGRSESVARAAASASAIPYGRSLDEREMQALVDQLFACPEHRNSPSGLPILHIIPMEEMDATFKN